MIRTKPRQQEGKKLADGIVVSKRTQIFEQADGQDFAVSGISAFTAS
jgi:hypothetical protein